MKKVSVNIRNGKITATAEGYKGQSCEAPLNAVKAALGGTVTKEEFTSEAYEPEEVACVENQEEQTA